MERRHFLKLTFGATVLAASANAAPLPQIAAPRGPVAPHDDRAEPAVVSRDDVDRLKPEQVRWHHRWHRWHRRHWGWHRRWRRHRW